MITLDELRQTVMSFPELEQGPSVPAAQQVELRLESDEVLLQPDQQHRFISGLVTPLPRS